MTEPRQPHRRVVLNPRLIASRRAIESAAQLRRVAATEPHAVLGVVAYWLGPAFSEGTNRVDA